MGSHDRTLIDEPPCSTAYYEAACARLGHDPLREDADGEALWEIVRNSKKSIGGILMDQTIIAGVGNIFRAEILFKVLSPSRMYITSWGYILDVAVCIWRGEGGAAQHCPQNCIRRIEA